MYHNNNNNGKEKGAPLLVVIKKTTLIRKDKKNAAADKGGGGAPLPNIIPKKSPPSSLDPAPVLLPLPLVVPPSLNPGYDMPTLSSLKQNHTITHFINVRGEHQ